MELLAKILPWVVALVLLFFTFINVSYVFGYQKAKKMDPSLKLALNMPGKIILGILYIGYVVTIVITIYYEIRIFTDATIPAEDVLSNALQALNALTIVTVIACLEVQDVYFIGKKNIMIGNKMFDIRRMRKFQFPKKTKILFIYGQKEYSYSTLFVDKALLKQKISSR